MKLFNIRDIPNFLAKKFVSKITLQVKSGFSSIRLIISESALLKTKVAKGFESFYFTLLQAYKLTDISPLVSNPQRKYKDKSIEIPIEGIDIKIDSPNEIGEGELRVRGPIIIKKYYRPIRKKLKGIFLIIIILTFSNIFSGCLYSFVKGTLSVKEYFLSGIENTSLNAELKPLIYDALIKQMKNYGNIDIIEEGVTKDTLFLNIKNYSRKEEAYDVSGNILTYSYSMVIEYTASSKRMDISVFRVFDAKLTEAECKDSIANESVKSFIDKLRSDF